MLNYVGVVLCCPKQREISIFSHSKVLIKFESKKGQLNEKIYYNFAKPSENLDCRSISYVARSLITQK